ncbi:MAG: RNA-binding protein, partial [Gammaproteobacteria bacterium]|nr:RNA-binding protein [Gammaproteobacteria bacterium]
MPRAATIHANIPRTAGVPRHEGRLPVAGGGGGGGPPAAGGGQGGGRAATLGPG